MERRFVSSRSNAAIRALARLLARSSITPNQISGFSIVASTLVPLGLFGLANGWGVALAVSGIQLRLLANVIDGLVAVEGGKSTPLGPLYNEFPDRIADSIILVTLGYVSGVPALGWACALLAALTAYIRVFGGTLGLAQVFSGPMAKQHRMAVASVALLAELGSPSILPSSYAGGFVHLGLAVIAAGSAWTCWSRTRGIARQVAEKATA